MPILRLLVVDSHFEWKRCAARRPALDPNQWRICFLWNEGAEQVEIVADH